MSNNEGLYQVTNDAPQQELSSQDISNAFDEKLIENSKVQEDTGQLGQEQSTEEEAPQQEDDKFSSKFAALSRKEKDIRSRESELERKIQEFEERFAQLNQPQEEPQEQQQEEIPLEFRLKKNPLQTLEEMGLGYDVLTKLAMNDGEMTPDLQMKIMREELERDYKSKFEQLENRLLEKEQAEEEAKYQQVIDNYKAQIDEFIRSDENYELIQVNEAQDLVYDLIEEHHNETGRILDTKEAADQVEQYLQEEYQEVLKKSKKLGSMLAPQEAKPQIRQSPTLSNSQSARGVTAASAERKLSEDESKARAASLIRWGD
jgi:hypothetical protein